MSLFDEDLTLPGVSTEIISDYDERREIGLFNKTASIINSD